MIGRILLFLIGCYSFTVAILFTLALASVNLLDYHGREGAPALMFVAFLYATGAFAIAKSAQKEP